MFFSEAFISATEIPLHLLKTVNSMMLNNVISVFYAQQLQFKKIYLILSTACLKVKPFTGCTVTVRSRPNAGVLNPRVPRG